MSDNSPSQTPERVNREDLEWDYLDELEFNPYPFQEEAIDSWFAPKEDGKHGTLVCAPRSEERIRKRIIRRLSSR